MTADERPVAPLTQSETTCRACGAPTTYDVDFDRWLHQDASDGRSFDHDAVAQEPTCARCGDVMYRHGERHHPPPNNGPECPRCLDHRFVPAPPVGPKAQEPKLEAARKSLLDYIEDIVLDPPDELSVALRNAVRDEIANFERLVRESVQAPRIDPYSVRYFSKEQLAHAAKVWAKRAEAAEARLERVEVEIENPLKRDLAAAEAEVTALRAVLKDIVQIVNNNPQPHQMVRSRIAAATAAEETK